MHEKVSESVREQVRSALDVVALPRSKQASLTSVDDITGLALHRYLLTGVRLAVLEDASERCVDISDTC